MSNFVSKDEIKKARQADIAQYLLSKGVDLVRVGKRYKSKDNDSLVFTNNAYYWNSRGEHGNALDFVTRHMKIDFATAVKELAEFSSTPSKSFEKEFTINNIELAPNVERSIAYLSKSRGIDYNIIQDLVKNKLLFQSKEKSNVVFPIRNEKSDIVGAELNGTLSDRRFKGIAENSAYGYGFNVRTTKIPNLKNYMFFESAIDMLSYINIQQINSNLINFKDTIFTSMGGLKINVVKNTLEAFKSSFEPNVFLCVDNISIDKAAYNFCQLAAEELKDIKVYSMLSKDKSNYPVEPTSGKDWNDQLRYMKSVSLKDKLEDIKSNKSDPDSQDKDRKIHSPSR